MSDTTSTPTTTVNAPAPLLSITAERVQQLLSFLARGQGAAVLELDQIKPIVFDPQNLAEQQKIKSVYVEKLSKSKMVYEKMTAERKSFTDPIKDAIGQIMAFENSLDPTKDNNKYAEARKVVEAFDQAVLNYSNQEKAKAELEKRVNQYKADIRANVEKRLLEMMTGQEKGLTTGMIKWEGGLTLENIDAKEVSLKQAPLSLSKEKYDACFTTDFGNKNPHLLAEPLLVEFVQSLKNEFTFAQYEERYMQMAAPIKNAYLAKIPDIKVQLEKNKNDAAAAEKRRLELEEQSKNAVKAIEEQAEQKKEEIDNKAEMGHYEAEFIEQGTNQTLPDQASKKAATFENENLWLQPLLNVISHVATHPKFKAKNSKGEFVPEISKWLKTYESCHDSKTIKGIVLTDQAKTVIRKNQ